MTVSLRNKFQSVFASSVYALAPQKGISGQFQPFSFDLCVLSSYPVMFLMQKTDAFGGKKNKPKNPNSLET